MKKLLDYIEDLSIDQKKYQLGSTYQTLVQVDDIIDFHNAHFADDKSEVVINIYGLLQSLFVGIDSLYSLVIGITNHKFNINVNQNKTLNGLKHIRNDIVGHPTNRRYGQTGIAYSVIDNNKLTYNEFIYNTYIFIDNKMDSKEVKVNLVELKSEYTKEKNIIIERLNEYIGKKPVTINLDNEIMIFYYESTVTNLNAIKEKFISYYGNVKEHRFMWRLSLAEFCLSWQTNVQEINDLIHYILKQQTIKLLEINNEMENKNFRVPYTKIPPVLRKVFKYLDLNEKYVEYLQNLHDDNNPFYEADLNYLLNSVTNKSLLSILNILKNTNSKEIIYLIGSTLKKYKKK